MQGKLLGCCHALVPRSARTVVRRGSGRRRGTIRISERMASSPERKTMTIAPHTMTLDEFLARHEDDPVLEYAQGVVTEKMAPSWPHGALASLIGEQINGFAHRR